MKKLLVFSAILLFVNIASAQSDDKLVEQACLNYLDGFYQGDTTKLIASLKPSLHKFGFWKDKDSGKYGKATYMTFEEAIKYAANVLEKKKFAKPDAPKKVEILDLMDKIAVAKISAWWGYDYILLAKSGDQWMIEQVIWQGPYQP